MKMKWVVGGQLGDATTPAVIVIVMIALIAVVVVVAVVVAVIEVIVGRV